MQRTKFFTIFLTFLVFLNVNILFQNIFEKNYRLYEPKFQIQLSYESSLDYGDYVYFYYNVGDGDKLKWEFSGSNTNIGITVFALTDTEFSKFQYFLTFYYYPLSDGSYYRDSGTFSPPSYDKWYVVFLNDDLDMQITYLTFNVDVERGFNLLAVLVIVPIIIIGLIIGIAISLSKKKKKKEAESISDKNMTPNTYESKPFE